MRRLEPLDYGRFLAAVAVMLFHYTFNGMLSGKISSLGPMPAVDTVTQYGYMGVHFFFMISGYTIAFSARNKTAAQFAVARLVRLYPAYWFAVIFTATFACFWGGPLMSVSLPQTLINLSMIQSYLGIANVDGVYWTLILELQFYFIVFIALFTGLKKHLTSLFILWPYLMALACLLGWNSSPLLGNFFYYFAAGSTLALISERFSIWRLLGLVFLFIQCLKYTIYKTAPEGVRAGLEYSPLALILINIAFFAFFWLLRHPKLSNARLPGSKLLGALSYPLYLIHAHFGYMVLSHFATEDNKIYIFTALFAILLGISYFIHRVLEVGLAPFWKKIARQSAGRGLDKLETAAAAIIMELKKRLLLFSKARSCAR